MKDDDDESAVTHARYPCIPSRVMLYQMKNQLHLAQLGKKLMKMTALATMKELRRIATIILNAYKDYEDSLRNCYILLARCRYFYPQLNTMVSEGMPPHPRKATVTTTTGIRCTTGAKVIQFFVHQNTVDNYSLTAIGQGGMAVREAKKAWYELLKMMVLMLELKMSFITTEISHKNATKKSNVLGKVVIPRINETIKYIKDELEELEREDFFRMKKIIEVKEKGRRKKKGKAEKEEAVPPDQAPCREPKAPSKEGIVCPATMKKPSPSPSAAGVKDVPSTESLPCPNAGAVCPIRDVCRPKPESVVASEEKIPCPMADICQKKTPVCMLGRSPSVEPFATPPEGSPPKSPFSRPCSKTSLKSPSSPPSKPGSKPSSKPSSASTSKTQSKEELSPCPIGGVCKALESLPASKICKNEVEMTSKVSHTQKSNDQLQYFDVETKEITKIIRIHREDGTVIEEIKMIKIVKEIPKDSRTESCLGDKK